MTQVLQRLITIYTAITMTSSESKGSGEELLKSTLVINALCGGLELQQLTIDHVRPKCKG